MHTYRTPFEFLLRLKALLYFNAVIQIGIQFSDTGLSFIAMMNKHG